jgi:hypothetical protein
VPEVIAGAYRSGMSGVMSGAPRRDMTEIS